jgi:cellobiose-specific phosphotransferase system component IIC
MNRTAVITKVLRFTGIRLSALLYEQLGAQPMLAALLAAPSSLQVREKAGRRKVTIPAPPQVAKAVTIKNR